MSIYWARTDLVKNKKKDIAALAWLTDSDLLKIQQELLFPRQQRIDGTKPPWFKTEVLDKYKNHRCCEVDVRIPFSCILIFIDNDKKHVVTSEYYLELIIPI